MVKRINWKGKQFIIFSANWQYKNVQFHLDLQKVMLGICICFWPSTNYDYVGHTNKVLGYTFEPIKLNYWKRD